jgi:hypothetical protein
VIRPLAVLLVVLLAALAGCGDDDDGGGDEEAIREVIVASLTTDEPETDCRERLSEGFVARTYGDRAACVRIQGEDEDGPDATAVDTPSIEVDGDAATATIEVTGGRTEGVEGELGLVREDGDWRVDELSVPLLRSLVELGLRSGQTEGLPAGGIECVQQELDALPDEEFRELAYQLVGETPEAERRTLEFLAGCQGEGGISLLRQAFEQGLIESLREQNASQAEIDCVISGIRERLSDDRLLELVSAENANEATAQELTPVVEACGVSGT